MVDGKRKAIFGLLLVFIIAIIGITSACSSGCSTGIKTYSDPILNSPSSAFTAGDTVYGQGVYSGYSYKDTKIEYQYLNGTVVKACDRVYNTEITTCNWENASAGTWKIVYYYSYPTCSNLYFIASATFTVNAPTPVCGNGILETGEECDDGNLLNGDGCSCSCVIELPTCDYNAGINYAYGSSDNTGINIGIGTSWIDTTPVNLTSNETYNVKIAVKNLGNDEIKDAHILVKIDGSNFYSEYKDLSVSTSAKYAQTSLNASALTCGLHTISVEISKENQTECDSSDNSASREIYVSCSTPVNYYCGDGIVNSSLGEECDGTNFGSNTCTSLGYDKGSLSCSATCKIETSGCEYKTQTVSKSLEVLEYNECVPNWECSGWSECSNGIMTRSCEDVNYCDYSYNKPLEYSECTVDKVLVENIAKDKHWGLFITGILLLVLLILIIINMRK